MSAPTGKAEGSEAGFGDFVDPRSARAAHRAMPSDRVVQDLAETFKALSDPTRVRIISALGEQELCVIDLAQLLGVTGSAISHQLRILRGQRLVKYRKEGKTSFYSLDDEHIAHLMAECIRHVTGD